MKYPKAVPKKRKRWTVSGFDGGVSGQDAPWEIGDNQLTDALNLWWKDGALRTRPGVQPISSTFYDAQGRFPVLETGGRMDLSSSEGVVRRKAQVYSRQAGGNKVYDAELSTLDYNGSEQRHTIFEGLTGSQYAGIMLAESGGTWPGSVPGGAVAFVGQGGTGGGGQILAQPAGEGPWLDIAQDAYVPLVMINGKGSATIHDAAASGTPYEGHNLLTPRFRTQFTTSGEEARFYFLPVKELDNAQITVRFTEEDGSVYTWVIPSWLDYSADDSWGIAVHVNRAGGYIYCVETQYNAVRWFPASGIRNNLEVTASKTRPQGRDTICSMDFCTWFGGDRSGYHGGTRLFVSGHPKHPNLIRWSDVNNLLYFPENNYAFIGDAGQAVTAFAKQGEKLIVFKERETYYTTYTAGSRTAQALPDGTTIDATTNAARFPVTQLHPVIGCDCPNTIQLCDNRLVWADSAGRVFSLAAANQYSESNVRILSGAAEKWLAEIPHTVRKTACAGDYRGHYMLMIGSQMLLFNYMHGSYRSYLQNVGGKGSSVPWMRWRLGSGFAPRYMMADGERLVLCGDVEWGRMNALLTGDADKRLTWKNQSWEEMTVPVAYMLQTPLFDFEQPHRLKTVRQAYIQADIQDGTMEAVCLTDYGMSDSPVPVDSIPSGGLVRISLHAVRVRCLGLRIQGNGGVTIGGVVMDAHIYGRGLR